MTMPDWLHYIAVAGAVLAGVVPLWIAQRTDRHRREAFEARVEQKLDDTASEVETLGKRLAAQDRAHDAEMRDMTNATINLAEIAGRAIGRTERD